MRPELEDEVEEVDDEEDDRDGVRHSKQVTFLDLVRDRASVEGEVEARGQEDGEDGDLGVVKVSGRRR